MNTRWWTPSTTMSPVDFRGRVVLESATADPAPVATSATELKRTASAVAVGRVRLRTMFSNPPERKT
jgi:hypothetical protein